jgi:aryl-alcohol dehydrogenase-like predicted oxidoreductase
MLVIGTRKPCVLRGHRRMNLSTGKPEHYLSELEKYKPLFDYFKDQSMAQVGLRFCLSHPACQTAIPRAKTSLQVNENIAGSGSGPIPEDILKSFVQKYD